MRGATCSSIATALPIQRIVPAVYCPATRRRRGASAATSTGTSASSTSAGAPAFTRNSSPAKRTASPRSRVVTIWTYSSVCRPGVAYDNPNMPSTTGAWDGPMPSVKRRGAPMADTTLAARFASRRGLARIRLQHRGAQLDRRRRTARDRDRDERVAEDRACVPEAREALGLGPLSLLHDPVDGRSATRQSDAHGTHLRSASVGLSNSTLRTRCWTRHTFGSNMTG